jgi:hypothetical protein
MVKREYNGKVRVDPKIESMIRSLTEDELNALEESLLAEGKAISPLWLWGDLLVDGHNRFRLSKKHKLPYEVKQVYEDATDIEDVKDRIRRDSLARRNMTAGEQSQLRAERVTYKIKSGETSADAIRSVAKESNVSVRQVQRDVKRAELIETLDDDLKKAAVAISTPVVKKLASLPKPRQQAIAKKADGDGKAIEKAIKAKGREKVSAAKLFASMQLNHFSGRSGLPQMLDAMAETNGGQGYQYKAANAGLDAFLKAASQMRDGKL